MAIRWPERGGPCAGCHIDRRIERPVNGTPTFFANGRRYDGYADRDSIIAALRGEKASRLHAAP